MFEKNVAIFSNSHEVKEKLSAAINKLPFADIEVGGKVDIDLETLRNTEDVRVTFHGDFTLSEHPTNFMEADRVCKNISSLMTGPNPQSVPMKVYLYALPKLDPTRSFAVFRDISDSLVSDVVQIMQDLEDYREEIQDFVGSVVYNHFPHIANKVDTFLDVLRRYQQNFNLKVSTPLPQIRGTRREENELHALVQAHYVGPFSKSTIDVWFRHLHAEMAVLKSFVDLLMPLRYASNEGEYITHITTNEQVISLNLYFPVRSDPTLDNLMRFVNGPNHLEAKVPEQEWHQQPAILNPILDNIRGIVQYQQANKDSPIEFIYVVLAHGYSHLQMPSSEIKAFNSMRSTDREESNLVLPSEPRDLTENVDDDENTIRWQPPQYETDFLERYAIIVTERGSRIG